MATTGIRCQNAVDRAIFRHRLEMPGIGDELHHMGWNACSGVCTTIGTFGGALAENSPCGLAALVAKLTIARAGLAPNAVNQVVFGNGHMGVTAENVADARND